MPDFSKKIVYLSQAQYNELITNDTITVDGVTINYNDNDIYVTPQAEPITDVKINGTSIGSNGVANIPLANGSTYGIMKVSNYNGVEVRSSDGQLTVIRATDNDIKASNQAYKPITPSSQDKAVFYGLAKVAGHDEKNSTESVGTYTDGAKAAIQNMLGITDLISTEESSTATAAHALNSTFMMNGKLHRATAAIAIGDAVEVGTNCEVVKADEVFVKNTDYATSTSYGIVKTNNGFGITSIDGVLIINGAGSESVIKPGTNSYYPLVANTQHISTFYGLSKVAGIDLANETVTLGTYPETSKTAIRNMLGATSSNVIAVQDEQPTDTDTKVWLPETEAQGIQVPTMDDMNTALAGKVSDVQINGTSIISNGVANIPVASDSSVGVVKPGLGFEISSVHVGQVNVAQAFSGHIKAGTAYYEEITPALQHESAFYGLAKAAGDTTQSISTNAVGTYTNDAKTAIQTMLGVPGDVQVNGTSVVSNGVANIPKGSSTNHGVFKIDTRFGIRVLDSSSYDGVLSINAASISDIKTGAHENAPIVPSRQHVSTFYGLAKAAGDTTMASSSNAVGIYTTEAQTAIQTMLGIDLQSIASEVDLPLVETVSGTTPTITGQPNVRYVCGEVSTISITPPASGSVDVIFESGSTATTMTVPSTVKWPAWFDAEALEANTTYEVLITDGIYGSVMTWAT